jgi:exodeoxyribonuclease III
VPAGIGQPNLDKEGRFLAIEFPHMTYMGPYIPNSGKDYELKTMGKKLNYLNSLKQFIKQENRNDKPYVLVGDMNLARWATDTYDNAMSEDNSKKPSCTKEERDKLEELINELELTDQMERFHKTMEYTWFFSKFLEMKNKGMRIDHAYANKQADKLVKYVTTIPNTYGSDHRPIAMITDGNQLRDIEQQHECPAFLTQLLMDNTVDAMTIDLKTSADVMDKIMEMNMKITDIKSELEDSFPSLHRCMGNNGHHKRTQESEQHRK